MNSRGVGIAGSREMPDGLLSDSFIASFAENPVSGELSLSQKILHGAVR